jgi:ERCC4-type nuclease
VIAIVDSPGQLPLNLARRKSELGTLSTGDYSMKGLEYVVCIERKSLADLLGCVGCDRERFERELHGMLTYPVRVLLVESSWQEIELGQWRSKLTPEHVIGSLLGWQASGLSIHMAGDHKRAGRQTARLQFTVARRRYAELRTSHKAMEPSTTAVIERT